MMKKYKNITSYSTETLDKLSTFLRTIGYNLQRTTIVFVIRLLAIIKMSNFYTNAESVLWG